MMSMLGLIGTAGPSAHKVGRAVAAHVQELGLVALVAAMAPLCRIDRSFDGGVNGLVPDATHGGCTRRPVLLVHGFAGTRACWFAVTRALREQGVTVDAINYLPFGTSVESLADRLAVKVATLLSETGADKVHLVGHSLGGVVIAQAFADGYLTGQVDTVVTIATPFGGSPWASLLPLGATVRALRGGSPLLCRLAAAPLPDGVRWMALTASLDVIVPGRRSVPAQAGVQTVAVNHVGHIGLLLSQEAVGRIVDALPIHERVAA